MKQILFTPTEMKILEMCLVDDDRVQQHHAYLFNCHYLPDIVQHLRKKLKNYFDVSHDTVKDNLYTESRSVIKENGKKAKIGIFRLSSTWKRETRRLLNAQKDEAQKSDD